MRDMPKANREGPVDAGLVQSKPKRAGVLDPRGLRKKRGRDLAQEEAGEDSGLLAAAAGVNEEETLP